MLQERERIIESLGVAVKVPQHQVLALTAEADAQLPFAACSAIDAIPALLLLALSRDIFTFSASATGPRQAGVLTAGCLR